MSRRQKRRCFSLEPLESRYMLSTVVLSDDFQSDLGMAQPATADSFWHATGPDGYIEVTGPGGRFPEPFGPAGNKSLVFYNPTIEQPAVTWYSKFSDTPADFRTGSFSFDLYMPEPTSQSWTYFDFRIGYGGSDRTTVSTVGDATIWNSFRVNSAAPDIVFDNGNGAGQSAIASQTAMHVEYQIDGITETYQLLIDGVAQDFGTGNPDRPWIAGAPGINMFGFYGAYGLTSAPVVIDNLVVTNAADAEPPEPWTPPQNEPTDSLEWHQHRGNKRLTGEATISQDIVSGAEVLWSQYVGSQESWFGVAPAPGSSSLQFPQSSLTMSQSESISWGIGGPYFDLAGTGGLSAQSTGSFSRIGDFIPGNGVLEKVSGEVFDTTYGQGVIRLYTYQNGFWAQQWESPEILSMFSTPNLIVDDFDNDGQLEVALTPWYKLYVLDMATGQVEQSATFKPAANQSGRGYGWLGAYDLNGDDRKEFVVMGDFQDFISVMGWNGSGDLVKLWDHAFDTRLANKQTLHRPGAFPVINVTGDGELEIVSTVFNETGDNRWHVVVRNALTGSVVNDLVDHAVDGTRDIDQDGDLELFVRQTTGSLFSETSTLKILNFSGTGYDTLWSEEMAGFVSQDIADFPLFVNSRTSTGKQDLLTGAVAAGEQELFFTRKRIDSARNIHEIKVWQLDGAEVPVQLGSATGSNLDVLATREVTGSSGSILLSAEVVGADDGLAGDYNQDARVDAADYTWWQDTVGQTVPVGSGADGDQNGTVDQGDYQIWRDNFGRVDSSTIELTGFSGDLLFSKSGSPPRSSAVVGRLDGPGTAPVVIVQGGAETIVAISSQGGQSMSTRWTRPGTGGFLGATQNQGQHENSGVALGDVTGDGRLETLYASRGDSGEARIVAANSTGQEIWHRDFDVPGGTRIFNEAGLTFWRTGHFTSPVYEDVMVQLMRGIGGTGELYLLDGQTGELLWTRDYGNTPGTSPVQRGASESHMAVYDWDGDGLDEAVNFNPDMFYVVDGDGTNLIDKSVYNGGVFPGGSPLYGAPVVADFRNDGTDTILFAGSYAQFGLVDKNALPVWNTSFVYDATPGFIQGVGDVDNDGDLDLFSPGHPVAPASYVVSKFNAYDGPTGDILWQVTLPGRPHSPVGGAYADTPTLSVSADIDGDGRVESVFAVNNRLYAVGANADGTSGSIEWVFAPDSGYLGSPIIADGNGDGQAEIIVVSTSGMVYGIGNPSGGATSSSLVVDPGVESIAVAATSRAAPQTGVLQPGLLQKAGLHHVSGFDFAGALPNLLNDIITGADLLVALQNIHVEQAEQVEDFFMPPLNEEEIAVEAQIGYDMAIWGDTEDWLLGVHRVMTMGKEPTQDV